MCQVYSTFSSLIYPIFITVHFKPTNDTLLHNIYLLNQLDCYFRHETEKQMFKQIMMFFITFSNILK